MSMEMLGVGVGTLVLGIYLGGIIVNYFHATPMRIKDEMIQRYGWGTQRYFEAYRTAMTQDRWLRFVGAAVWPWIVCERDRDLIPRKF